jgi:hypothetical protein
VIPQHYKVSPLFPWSTRSVPTPMKHAEYREKVIKKQIRPMHERGIWAVPGR